MATQFFQLRSGDSFVLQEIEYMKLHEHRTVDNSIFNAVDAAGNFRYVLPDTKVIPNDEYYLNRITPVDVRGNRVDD